MSKYYIVNSEAIYASEIWPEATAEELRVLVFLVANEGKAISARSLADACHVKPARARSSISLWEREGVITECDKDDAPTAPRLVYEFEERHRDGVVDEERSIDVADTIRNGELQELFHLISDKLNKPALNDTEIKHISGIYSQLGLSPEYILTLAEFISSSRRLTTKLLRDEAERLSAGNVTTVEELETHIEMNKPLNSDEREVRDLIGAYNRKLSDREREYIKKWMTVYGYAIGIIGEAYSEMLEHTGGKLNFKYMDKIIARWHENGCKTLDDIKALRDKGAPVSEPTKRQPRKKTVREEPSLTSFTTDDALARALARSYGEGDK